MRNYSGYDDSDRNYDDEYDDYNEYAYENRALKSHSFAGKLSLLLIVIAAGIQIVGFFMLRQQFMPLDISSFVVTVPYFIFGAAFFAGFSGFRSSKAAVAGVSISAYVLIRFGINKVMTSPEFMQFFM